MSDQTIGEGNSNNTNEEKSTVTTTVLSENKNNPLPLQVSEARIESCQIIIGNSPRYNLKHFSGIRNYNSNLHPRINII